MSPHLLDQKRLAQKAMIREAAAEAKIDTSFYKEVSRLRSELRGRLAVGDPQYAATALALTYVALDLQEDAE